MRTFILGVGAQKSGTTWLFRQLCNSETFIKGLMKEYHLFDEPYLGINNSTPSNIIRRLKNNQKIDDNKLILKNVEIIKSFYRDEEKYFDYIDSLLKNDTDFTADITPSYACLPCDVLAKIKSKLNQRGIAVKVVFLMREPISRLESSVRMRLRNNNQLHSISQVEMTQKMHDGLNSQNDLLRANYSYTSKQLEQAFCEEDIFYGFYETLFSEIELRRLSTFLNIPYQNFDATKVINASAKLFKYSLEDINKFKERVQDRYQFISERFEFDLSLWDDAVSKMVAKKKRSFLKRIFFSHA